MWKNWFVILAIALILAGFYGLAISQRAPLETAEVEVMVSADRLYQNGHYEEAARMYQQLIAQGVRDASLYFNLGNAALNMGQPEAALSYFEDALKLDPRDPDIQANLELTRSLTGIQAATGSANPVIGGLMKIRKSLSRDEIAAASLALWFGLGFMFITITRRRNSRRRIGSERIVLTGLLGLGLLVLGAALGPNIPAS